MIQKTSLTIIFAVMGTLLGIVQNVVLSNQMNNFVKQNIRLIINIKSVNGKNLMKKAWVKLNREEKVIIYIFKVLNKLTEDEILIGNPIKINETDEFKKEMENFEPTEEEIISGMSALQKQGFIAPPRI